MKKLLLLAALALALPTAVFAGSTVDYTNTGGNLMGSSSGLTLTGSILIATNGLNGLGLVTGDLGSVNFATGALLSGSLTTTSCSGGASDCVIATFASTGSWFKITGNGTNGIPNGTLFSGTFKQPITLSLDVLSNGTHLYEVSGNLGTGVTYETATNSGKGYFDGGATITSGDTTTVVVPEPASLGLLGTGLIGLAGIVRRKLKA